MNKIVLAMLFLMLSSCAYYSPIYWGWGEWVGSGVSDREDHFYTKFDWPKLPGVITVIDGDSVGNGYKKAKLLPGIHLIEYAYYPAEFGIHPIGSIELDFEEGHIYEFRIKLCYSCNPRRYAVWINDKTIDNIVWGNSKRTLQN